MTRPSIVSVIGEHISLRRVGKEHLGLCPFHAEKTPSLTVNEEKGLFHCFGCGESGDVIDFVMKVAGLSFLEALASLGIERGRISERRPDPIKKKAVTICRWTNEQTQNANNLLRVVGQRMQLAGELKWQEETDRLTREWEILSDLSDDLQDPKQVIGLWEEREAIENLLQDAEPEPLPEFPEITPEYREQLRRYVRGYDA